MEKEKKKVILNDVMQSFQGLVSFPRLSRRASGRHRSHLGAIVILKHCCGLFFGFFGGVFCFCFFALLLWDSEDLDLLFNSALTSAAHR